MEIQGSNAVMVGGASGMCLATAEKFVERGGKVAILDLERSDGAAVAERLGGHFFPCNVMDYAAMEAVIGEAVAPRQRPVLCQHCRRRRGQAHHCEGRHASPGRLPADYRFKPSLLPST